MKLSEIDTQITAIEQALDYDTEKLMENRDYKRLCAEACNMMTIQDFWLWCKHRPTKPWKNNTL